MFRQQIIPIPAKLRAFVRRIWLLEPGEALSDNQLSIYADGCPGIIFQESENGLFLNQKKELSPVFLYGQTVAPIDMHARGRLRMIVVNFQPYTIHSLFRLSANELTDDCLDTSLLPGAQGRGLLERLWNSGSAPERVSVLFEFLEQMIARNSAVADAGMAHATASLLQTNGGMSLPSLQKILNLSPRTFERRFERYIGISPKLFSKISQFQAALRHLQSGRYEKLSDIAYMYGYADQSHFIRNFSKFTGLSPLRWQRHAGRGEADFPGLAVQQL